MEMENQQDPAERFFQASQGAEADRPIPYDPSADFWELLAEMRL
jgi:hypothetical protein